MTVLKRLMFSSDIAIAARISKIPSLIRSKLLAWVSCQIWLSHHSKLRWPEAGQRPSLASFPTSESQILNDDIEVLDQVVVSRASIKPMKCLWLQHSPVLNHSQLTGLRISGKISAFNAQAACKHLHA